MVSCLDQKFLSDRQFFVCTGVLLASEWWALEIAIMMGGLLPDAALQLSAMAIYNSTNDLCFMVSNGMAVAVSTRHACTVTHAYQSMMHFNVAAMDVVCWRQQYVKPQSAAASLPPACLVHVHMHTGSPTDLGTSSCMQASSSLFIQEEFHVGTSKIRIWPA